MGYLFLPQPPEEPAPAVPETAYATEGQQGYRHLPEILLAGLIQQCIKANDRESSPCPARDHRSSRYTRWARGVRYPYKRSWFPPENR